MDEPLRSVPTRGLHTSYKLVPWLRRLRRLPPPPPPPDGLPVEWLPALVFPFLMAAESKRSVLRVLARVTGRLSIHSKTVHSEQGNVPTDKISQTASVGKFLLESSLSLSWLVVHRVAGLEL